MRPGRLDDRRERVVRVEVLNTVAIVVVGGGRLYGRTGGGVVQRGRVAASTIAIAVVARARTVGRDVLAVGHARRQWLLVHLHVLAQRTGMGVALVAVLHLAIVRLVARVHMRVLLPVRTVCKPSITAIVFALERFFSCSDRE